MRIRDEYKVWIYKHYFIPSIRFLLTVHTISQSQQKELDTFTDKLDTFTDKLDTFTDKLVTFTDKLVTFTNKLDTFTD